MEKAEPRKLLHDPKYDVGRLINTVSHQLKRQMCEREAEDGVTNMQRHILHYILFQSLKRDIYQKDIEKEFQVRRSTATGALQLLEKNGFIRREPVPWDARLKKIVPTAKAEDLRENILDNICFMESVLRRDISEEEMAVCMNVLEQMSENLNELEQGGSVATEEDLSVTKRKEQGGKTDHE